MSAYRVIIAGCGHMARAWVQEALARRDVDIVGLVDIKREAAETLAEQYGLECGIYVDLEEALRTTAANLVFDVTIPESRYQICSTAMRMGADVFCEKPMAATMREARELLQLADETGRTFAVMQNRRFSSKIRSFKALLEEGTIGRIGQIDADFYIGAHFEGFRQTMDSPLLLDMAVHTFDEARFLSGADPISVYCHEFNPPGSWFTGNANAVCIFEMSDGSIFTYRGSWCSEGAHTSWDAEWRISGDSGTASWNGEDLPHADVVAPGDHAGQLVYPSNRIEASDHWPGRYGHQGCFDDLFAALNEGRPAETDCHDNIKGMAMVHGAIDSARQGRKIDLRPYYM